MSRHAAATTAGRARTIKRTPVPAMPRRVSGPARPNRRDDERARSERGPGGGVAVAALAYADTALAPRTRVSPVPRTFAPPRPQRLAYGGVAIASRMAGVALDVSGSRAMDRLVRSRVWIGVIAFGLIGLVAMQVSLLKLNSGIGRAVQTASTLERSNSTLRAEISTLSAGDRIQRLAAAQNMVMPAPADVAYVRAGSAHGDAARAARLMHAPDPSILAGPAGAATQALAPPSTMATPLAGAAPAGTVPAGTAPVSTAPASTGIAPATTGAAGTTPAAPIAQPTPAAPQTTAATATPAPAASPSGGASPQQATGTTP